MEFRPTILQNISQAITPEVTPSQDTVREQSTGGSSSVTNAAAVQIDRPVIEHVSEALKTGDANLLLSAQEKDIIEVLFVKQLADQGANGFSLYGSQSPTRAVKGSFIDFRG